MARPRGRIRVISGTAKGRRLDVPAGGGTRPVTDRVKESVFGALGPRIPGARVLDLYAGSGALAIEALSRGATTARLVERSKEACEVIRANLLTAGFADRAVVDRGDVTATLRSAAGVTPHDLVFLDPPYDSPAADVEEDLGLLAGGWVSDRAVVVIRRRSGEPEPVPVAGFEFARVRKYGDTLVLIATPT